MNFWLAVDFVQKWTITVHPQRFYLTAISLSCVTSLINPLLRKYLTSSKFKGHNCYFGFRNFPSELKNSFFILQAKEFLSLFCNSCCIYIFCDVPCLRRTWAIQALHNFLSFLSLNNVCLFTVPFILYSAIYLH